jgi:hypothetical protein
MNVEDLTVVVPKKENFGDDTPIKVWPLVSAALERIGADEVTHDSARNALETSHGCLALAHYLVSEGRKFQKMDFSFRAPLLVLAFQKSEQDDGADCLYVAADDVMYYETDVHQFGFNVMKDFTVDWLRAAHDRTKEYDETTVDGGHGWALDHLLEYADIAVESYRRRDDEL